MAGDIDILEELRWRGLLHQCTDEQGLIEHLNTGVRRAYCGYDPTADSLTIGNLVTIMMLRHWQRAGHKPVVVMGGGTGLIGDPSFKDEERQLRTPEEIERHIEAQQPIFHALLDFETEATRPSIVNNAHWLASISYIDALRDIGKHFSVNMMMQKESIRARLERPDQGISYTEFSYMILQAFDFLELNKWCGVTTQLGGSDQFGNIVAGIDLIRKTRAASYDIDEEEARAETFGLTCPLVTKADGTKFGKTESGAIWLTADRTSPYAYYQFWLNTPDADVGRFLRIFTLLPREEIEALETEHAQNPAARTAQRALAREATSLLHGAEPMNQAEAAGRALFSGDLSGLDERTLADLFAEIPSTAHPRSALEGEGADPVELLVETGLAKSKREAREFIASGSVSVSGRKLAEGDRVTPADLLHGSMIAIRRGKKSWHLTRWG